ncbi:hypothetical protein [Thermogemmatispora aurantia]|nr:hypothetical protein [Thermogemmatispora aurantia]
MLPKNTFGHLIRTYRRLRGWSQIEHLSDLVPLQHESEAPT